MDPDSEVTSSWACTSEMHMKENSRRLKMHEWILKSYITVAIFSFDVKTWKEKIGLQFFFVQNLSSDIITARILFQDLPLFFFLSIAFYTKIRINMLNLALVKLLRHNFVLIGSWMFQNITLWYYRYWSMDV